jgi:hypothetical protein
MRYTANKANNVLKIAKTYRKLYVKVRLLLAVG